MEWPSSWSGPRQPGQDIVSVKGLQLPHGVHAPDAWGKTKEQPALLSVTLTLKSSFSSAGSKDELDDSTIHYGKLAKSLRARSKSEQTCDQVISSCALDTAIEMGERSRNSGGNAIAHCRAELLLPKASMFGLCGLVCCYDASSNFSMTQGKSWGFFLKDVNLMCLVGVNEYERAGKQPVVVNFSLDEVPRPEAFLFQIERLLIEVCDKTNHGTLGDSLTIKSRG